MRNKTISKLFILSASAMALTSCAASPGPVIEKSTSKLISYFEAKNELAAALQASLSGVPEMAGGRETPVPYRLVAINGPAYPIGSLIPLDNALDLESRDCVIVENKLPKAEPWASFPSWTSSSKLDLGLNMPALFRGIFSKAENSLDTGVQFERSGNFQVNELSQIFLSRLEVSRAVRNPKCKQAIEATQNGAAIFVRGLVYGKESLKSGLAFSSGVNAKSVESPNGEFRISFDNSGAFELAENGTKPKFAIITKVAAKPRKPEADGIKIGTNGTDLSKQIVAGPPQDPLFRSFSAPSAEEISKVKGFEAKTP